MRICGVDEAGKGPVIGPLVIAGVCCEEDKIEKLKELGIRDSKRLSPSRRKELAEKIGKICQVEVRVIPSEELNHLMEGQTINEILLEGFASIISSLKPDIAYIDCFDVNPERLSNGLKKLCGVEIVAEHSADSKYVIVAAASIIAKVERDEIIEELKKEIGDFGSGYASDERTRKFIRDYMKEKGNFPPHVRKKWKTLGKLSQMSFSDFE
jgi:ribonuclease HII